MKTEILEILETMLGTNATAIITDEDAIEYGGNGIFYSQFDNEGLPAFVVQSTENCKVAAGCSRLVLIPRDKDYVIKLPITTVGRITYDVRVPKENFWNCEIVTSEDDEYYYMRGISEVEYLEYENNFFEVLEKRFTKTREQVTDLMDEENAYFDDEPILREILLENTYEGDFNGIPVYTQKKASSYDDEFSYKSLSAAEQNVVDKINKATWGEIFPARWTLDCVEEFGEELTIKIFKLIHEFGIDADMNWDNFGYINRRPVIFDFASYYEENVWHFV